MTPEIRNTRAPTGICWDELPIHEMALRRIASSLTRRNDKNMMKNAPGKCAREIGRDARKKAPAFDCMGTWRSR